MPDKPLILFITCEHGENRVPKRFEPLFRHGRDLLESHRGYDAGALDLAKKLSQGLNATLFYSTITRLLIDVNRSPHNPNRFSEITRTLDRAKKAAIENLYYHPYRDEVRSELSRYVRNGRQVLHISVHSFTPVLHGKIRDADLGFLYDPDRKGEAEFCILWQCVLREFVPGLLIRRNHPYRGTSDGFTRYLRNLFPEDSYLGVEIEINQKLLSGNRDLWMNLQRSMLNSLRIIVNKKGQQ